MNKLWALLLGALVIFAVSSPTVAQDDEDDQASTEIGDGNDRDDDADNAIEVNNPDDEGEDEDDETEDNDDDDDGEDQNDSNEDEEDRQKRGYESYSRFADRVRRSAYRRKRSPRFL